MHAKNYCLRTKKYCLRAKNYCLHAKNYCLRTKNYCLHAKKYCLRANNNCLRTNNIVCVQRTIVCTQRNIVYAQLKLTYQCSRTKLKYSVYIIQCNVYTFISHKCTNCPAPHTPAHALRMRMRVTCRPHFWNVAARIRHPASRVNETHGEKLTS